MTDKKIKNFKGMDYVNLSNSTKERIFSVVHKAYKSGNSLYDLKKMNDNDFALNLGIKKGKRIKGNKFSNIESYRKLINQALGSQERRKGNKEIGVNYYKQNKYSGKRLDQITKDFSKTLGSIFTDISADIMEINFPKSKYKNPNVRQRASDKYTKELLLIPKHIRKELDKKERNILDFWSP